MIVFYWAFPQSYFAADVSHVHSNQTGGVRDVKFELKMQTCKVAAMEYRHLCSPPDEFIVTIW